MSAREPQRTGRRLARIVCALAIIVTAAACSDPGSGPPTAAVDPGTGGSAGNTGNSGSGGSGSSASVAPPPTAAITAPPALPTGASKTVPASIANDCSADVTDALTTWIESVPDNSTLVLGKNACYRLDGTLTIDGRHRLLLDGNGATLKAVTRGKRIRGQLALKGGTDLTVRDLTVRGANPHAGASAAAYVADLEAQHAFSVHGVTHALLDHVQAYDTYGDFVYIGPEQKTPSQGVTVANSTFARSGRQGISITDATGVTIEANAISAVARSLIDIEPNLRRQSVRDVNIVGNVTGAAVNFWFANKGAAASIGNIVVSDNRMAAPTGGLVFVFARRGSPRGPYTFEHNDLIANDQVTDEGATGAFFFTLADNIAVRDNTVTFPSGRAMPAVELRDAHHVTVAGNQFTGAGQTILADSASSDYHAS